MYSFISALVLALASLTAAQIPIPDFDIMTSPPNQTTYEVGWAIPIIWRDSLGEGENITLTLIGGSDPAHWAPVLTIDRGIRSSTKSWLISIEDADVDPLLPSYGINLTLDSNSSIFQYSYPFYIVSNPNPITTTIFDATTDSMVTTAGSASSSTSMTVTTTSGSTGAGTTGTETKPMGSSNSTNATASPTPSGTSKSSAGIVVGSGLAVFAGIFMALLL